MALGSSKEAFLRAVDPPKKDPAAGLDAFLDKISEIAKLLNSDTATRARLADLKAAAERAQAQIDKAAEDVAGAARLMTQTHGELAAERKAHDERLAAEVAAHEAAMKIGRDELAAAASALAADRKAFEADAAKLKARADALKQHLEAA